MKKFILILIVILVLTGCSNSNFSIYNSWETNNHNLYVFNKDNTFFFYNNIEDLKNNYFSGDFTIKNKQNALNELNLTKDDLKYRNWKSENLYSIKLFVKNFNFGEETFSYEPVLHINLMLYNDTTSDNIILYDITNGYEMHLTEEGSSHSHNLEK